MHISEKWFLKGRKGDSAALAAKLGISRQLASLLLLKIQNTDTEDGSGAVSEAYSDAASEFLCPDKSLLYDAALLKDMDKALDTLREAAASQKKTLVIGDYDVDGIMGALILCGALKKALKHVSHYIPHRVDDGYGINDKIVRAAYEDGVELIVTCDNGMSAHDSIRLAKELGIEVIISDHHDASNGEAQSVANGETLEAPGAYELPPADAVVNPKRRDCAYPFKDLCGAAVAYKLAIAFEKAMGLACPEEEHNEYLCYATIATICDIVELVDENRRIVYHGLKLLNEGVKNPGLAELIRTCGLSGRTLTTYEVGHIIGPCINAAGRLDTAELSYALFTETDRQKICAYASELLDLNRKRQDLTARAYDSAVFEIGRTGMSRDQIIVMYLPDTHESICGIVAGKLKDKYARPVVVFTDSASGRYKGSGRSIDGYDLLSCVKAAGGLLEKYGGHKMAVGIMIEKENLALFREELNAKCGIGDDLLTPKERVDLFVAPEEIAIELVGEISRLEPFGRGNEKPVLALKSMAIESAALIGSKRNVIKIKFRSGPGRFADRYGVGKPLIEAVYFGDVDLFAEKLGLAVNPDGTLVNWGIPAVSADVTFYLEINDYNGIRKVQLVIRSVRRAAGA